MKFISSRSVFRTSRISRRLTRSWCELASGDIIKRRLYFHSGRTSGHWEKSNGRNLSRIVRSKRIDGSAL